MSKPKLGLKLLDCTLRDGAHINGGAFGGEGMRGIAGHLAEAGVDLIEVGFIEPDQASDNETTFFRDTNHVEEAFAGLDKRASQLGVMLRTDRCPLDVIYPSDFIDFIRIAFYEEHLVEVERYVNALAELGYSVYLNPIGITQFTPEQFKCVIEKIAHLNIEGVSIVDTYGALTPQSIDSYAKIIAGTLPSDMAVGLHLHQNLNLSAAVMDRFFEFDWRRMIVDGSINGMGRMPGNYETEMIAASLNERFNRDYKIDRLLLAGAQYVAGFKSIEPWGYTPIYTYSALLNIDRSYPEYFEKQGLDAVKNLKAQGKIAEQNIIRFRSDLADDVIAALQGEV